MKNNYFDFKTTAEIRIPKMTYQTIIGQDEAVNVIKKAAKQRRNVLLIGTPGTGKSLCGQALAELQPKSKLVDILCLNNYADEDNPLIQTVPAGKGRPIVQAAKVTSASSFRNQQIFFFILAMISLAIPWYLRKEIGDIMAAASLIAGMMFVAAFSISIGLSMRMSKGKAIEPKLLVDNSETKKSPFVDATGSHAGSLLGDVRHDPLQSGGLGTPANLRVIAGAIHKANGGVLFIDEIATLDPHTQQELLTSLQEKKYPITGQSDRSSGAMTRTQPVPCDFILCAAGNVDTVQKMHPALRSRIRGYGYEVYMNDTLKDTPENQKKIARFVAQEVVKDGKIPHFTREAVEEIIKEARRRASRKGHLTLILRDLGGLVRAAGDLALEEKAKLVQADHVQRAKKLARPLEQQIADQYIDMKKEYDVIITKGEKVGRVNGLAVIGSGEAHSGITLPIEAEVTEGGKKAEQFVATGKLGDIAKEAITNVSAIVKKLFGKDLGKDKDIYVQFLMSSEGVEGDSASVAVAVAIISALEGIPVRQDTAMTGSLSIRGEVLPVGGVTAKVEAAVEAGIKRVIVPESNLADVVISNGLSKIEIIPVKTIQEALKEALVWKGKEAFLRKLRK